VSDAERALGREGAEHYVALAASYRVGSARGASA